MAQIRKKTAPPATTTAHLDIALPWWGAGLLYLTLAAVATFPLVFRPGSTLYGFYDHATTDMFNTIYYYFWWIPHALFGLKTSPLVTPLFCAPFGGRVNFVNFTGFAVAPLVAVIGTHATYNLTIVANLVASALGMFLLVKHVTKSRAAGLVAGVAFGFCTNMLVRSYTTFDSTQVQWLPFYTLYLLRFIEDRTWKNIVGAGIFLAGTILFSMPYYLVFLPVHTVAVLGAAFLHRVVAGKRGWGGVVRDMATPAGYAAVSKALVVLACAFAVFWGYYSVVFSRADYTFSYTWGEEQLENLSLKPGDYLVPHPRSTLFKGDVKESYWNSARPGKDPDNFTAYLGFVILGLAALGAVTGRRTPGAWVFGGVALVAFWSTLGPRLFGLPTPSGLIHATWAPFARRILIYKVYVQLGVAGLAGLGTAWLTERLRSRVAVYAVAGGLALAAAAEYAIVPPALSVDMSVTPEIYTEVAALPEGSAILEAPVLRLNGNQYQGYFYYQTIHHKPLFNPYTSTTRIPERLLGFYQRMEVPLESQEYANLAALRHLGISHLVWHWHIGTKTVYFRSLPAPGLGFYDGTSVRRGVIDGLAPLYQCGLDPARNTFTGPYDYTFADLYEITAEPCPVALTFDYPDPYAQVPGMLAQDAILPWGWASALVDTTATFYFPVAEAGRCLRLLRHDGVVTAVNLGDEPVRASLSFTAISPDSGRIIEAVGPDGASLGRFVTGDGPLTCALDPIDVPGAGTTQITIRASGSAFAYPLSLGDRTTNIPVGAILADFRVTTKP